MCPFLDTVLITAHAALVCILCVGVSASVGVCLHVLAVALALWGLSKVGFNHILQ